MQTDGKNYLVGGHAASLFENSDAIAYLWHNGTAGGGTIGAGYIPVSGTPGATHKIVGGEGFSVKFSEDVYILLTGSVQISLHLAEQY